jgi:hypothetical protein
MDTTQALLRYTLPIEKGAAQVYRMHRGMIEFDELRVAAMELVAGYVSSGKLDKWEKLEDPEAYVSVVLKHDLQDYAVCEQRRLRRQQGQRPGRFAAPLEQGVAPRTLRRWRRNGYNGCGLPVRRLTHDEKQEIVRLRRQGLGSRAIAGILERERDTVRYWVRKFDRTGNITQLETVAQT